MVSALGSRVGWTPACKERTNKRSEGRRYPANPGSTEKWPWKQWVHAGGLRLPQCWHTEFESWRLA